MPEYQSLVGQLNGLTVLPQPDPTLRYHWQTVANSALASMTRALFANTSADNKAAIALLEGQFELQFKATLDNATYARSVQFGHVVAAALHQWAISDGGYEGQLKNFPADFRVLQRSLRA